MLRYWAPSQYQGRFTHADATFEGGTIPAGQPVLLITGAANRDERAYENPDVFDIDREPGSSRSASATASTRASAPRSARLESRVAFEEIAARWPSYEVDEAGLRRVQMSNVAGYSNVPVSVTA